MKSIQNRADIAERSFLLVEERSFHSRVKVDREAGLWIAGRLGLSDAAADAFAGDVVAAGLWSVSGRGGFDHLVSSLERAGVHIEELRTRYAIALAAQSLPPLAAAAESVLHS